MSSIGYCCAYVTPTATIVEATARNIQERLLIEISRGASMGTRAEPGCAFPGSSEKMLIAHLVALLLPHRLALPSTYLVGVSRAAATARCIVSRSSAVICSFPIL